MLPHFYTLDAELAYVTVDTKESDLESTNWFDNDQTMDFQVQFKLFLQLTLICNNL